MPTQATVSEISETDIPEIAAFLARNVRAGEAQPANPRPPADRLRWLLLENPARAAGIPFGWQIRDSASTVVGCALCTPWKIGAAGYCGTALMFSKFFVDEAYRGMGLGLLMRFVREGRKFPLFCTSTNAVAGKLFGGVGGSIIGGMDHTMLGVARPSPLVEEWLHRRSGSAALARFGAWAAIPLRGRIRPGAGRTSNSHWTRLQNSNDAAALDLPPPTQEVAVCRDRDYLHWRYYSGDGDIDTWALDTLGEPRRFVALNLVRAGHRAQIRVLNVLDVWPPLTPVSAPLLASRLVEHYRGKFDALWLRSQPAGAEAALAGIGFVRHDFPAPLGWYIDRESALPTHKWYLVPGESE